MTYTVNQIQETLGLGSVLRLQHADIGRNTLKDVYERRPALNQLTQRNNAIPSQALLELSHAINVLNNPPSGDPHLGVELVGMLVKRDFEEYRDAPEAAVMLAADLLTKFNISSRAGEFDRPKPSDDTEG